MSQDIDYISKYLHDFSFSEDENTSDDEQSKIKYKASKNNFGNISAASAAFVSSASPQSSIPLSEMSLEEKKLVWDSYPKAEQPKELDVKLFPHQLVSIYKMEELERNRRIKTNDGFFLTDFGILGDIPGYGKSFSVVSLILRDKMNWDLNNMYEKTNISTFNDHLKLVSKQKRRRIRPNLILASSTLIEQWKEYFSFVKKNKLQITEIVNRSDVQEFDPNKWDVVLVSSNRYNDLIDKIGSHVVWKRFIFDEASSTHISSMRHVSAGFTWFVTATYRTLLYTGTTRDSYMKAFFNHFSPTMLKQFVIENEFEFVKNSFKMPSIIEINHKCQNPRILNILGNHIDSEVKLMISAGDIRGAISRLGGGFTSNSNLFELVSKKQNEKLSQAKFSLTFWKSRNSAKEIEIWTKRVEELEKVLKDLQDKYQTVLEDDCTICYSEIEDPVLIPCCQNVFCGKCIMSWLEKNKTCPLCRSVVDVKDILYIDTKKKDSKEDKNKYEDREKRKQKQEVLCDIVKNGIEHGKKFLIFSSFEESFCIIERELIRNDISFVEICGTKATRDSRIKKFKDGKVSVVFLNSKFNGAGINLEMSTDIILYHEMPSDVREQVVGRALRIGREKDLTIHNLIF